VFQNGGEVNGRTLAYLAHEHFRSGHGISSIIILWFVGGLGHGRAGQPSQLWLPCCGIAPD
jgi:hypothetical protein